MTSQLGEMGTGEWQDLQCADALCATSIAPRRVVANFIIIVRWWIENVSVWVRLGSEGKEENEACRGILTRLL
jgi:hypothetical protein